MQQTKVISELEEWAAQPHSRSLSRSWSIVNRSEGGVIIEIRDGLVRSERVIGGVELRCAKFDILSANVHQLIDALSEELKEYQS